MAVLAKPVPLQSVAIVVHPDDNVAVVREPLSVGTSIQLAHGEVIEIAAAIEPGHRFALRDIPKGTHVLQYGQPIGTSLGIAQGQPITHENMNDHVPTVRDVPPDLATAPPNYMPAEQRRSFMGFRRVDGRCGTRNFILMIPTSMCASHEATQVATLAEFTLFSREKFPNVDGVTAIPHSKGCGCQEGSPVELLLRVLSNYADHPNVGGVVLLELGCEKTNLSVLETYLQRLGRKLDKPLVRIGIQQVGGTQQAIQAGLRAVEEMLPEVNKTVRQPIPVSELVLGVKCGGSDAFSGISANPSLGYASDLLVESGGTVLITEVPEFCGAEHILAQRAKDAATARAVYEMVDWYKDYAGKWGAVLNENPSPGNIKGGLLNITIKSLGAIAKAGTTRVEGVTSYGVPPRGKGLFLMQGPGYDQESTPGLVAAGANVVVFTTGRGSTIGNAIAPVIKLSSNNAVFQRMSGDLDLSAGDILDGKATIAEVGVKVFDHICRVAGGEVQAKAEIHKHREFQVWTQSPISL
ncbi:MAG TPA: altronate dehydratase family protein [Candidatus Angelobacter sp.]|nr:altronate dehydratase family protein [Candidatus Angelobacter sp.]